MIKRIDECKNSSEESSTEKVSNHIPCEYSTSMIWTFCGTYKKDDVYRGEDYIKKSHESLREDAIKIITLKRKLSNFQQVSTSLKSDSHLSKKIEFLHH